MAFTLIPLADELIILTDETGEYKFSSLHHPPRLEGTLRILLPPTAPEAAILRKAYPHAVFQWDAHARAERKAYASLINLHDKALEDGIQRLKESFTPEAVLVHAWQYAEQRKKHQHEARQALLTILQDIAPLSTAEHGEKILHQLDKLQDPTLREEYLPLVQREAARLEEEERETRELEEEVLQQVQKIAPVTSRIATPRLLIRLLTRAGTLQQLARMHAGKIQLLGSEKALFTALRKGKPTPKYGLIYQHPLVQRLPKAEKARAARVLAELISIAARHDAYTRGDADEIIRLAERKLKAKNLPTDWLQGENA